jgi:hypothetical protein
MMVSTQDKLWDKLVREVEELPKDFNVEIVDYRFCRREMSEVSVGEKRVPRRIVKWPMAKPRSKW